MEIIWKEQGGATCHAYDGGLPSALTADGTPQRTVWTTEARPGVMVFVYGGQEITTEVGTDYFGRADQQSVTLPGVEVGGAVWPG